MIPNISCGDRTDHGRHMVTTSVGQFMCPGSGTDAVKLVTTSPAPAAGSWTCHICGDERPDDKISVRQHQETMENGVEVTQNVRYCNDRRYCVLASIDYRHMPTDSSSTALSPPVDTDE